MGDLFDFEFDLNTLSTFEVEVVVVVMHRLLVCSIARKNGGLPGGDFARAATSQLGGLLSFIPGHSSIIC